MDSVVDHTLIGKLDTERTARFVALFEPESVAIVGASSSPGKWGFRVLFNTIEAGYRGRLYAVNPKHESVLNVPSFPKVSALPEPVDLAVIVVPPPAVPGIVRECAAEGVKAVVVITAGFGELENDQAGALQDELVRIAREAGMLMVGPNCAGLIGTEPYSLCCGMPPLCPKPGRVAMVSQSGNIGSTAVQWAELHQIGISRYVSSGNEAATKTEDFLRFFADDPKTAAILSYLEGVSDGRHLYDALKYASSRKPVVLIKGGWSDAGAKAARSHTGSLAAPTELFRAACRQAGTALVENVYEAVQLAATFASQPLPRGRRVAIVTRGGGYGVIVSDACAAAGLDVVTLPEDTLKELDTLLPGWWSRGNPVDLAAGLKVPTDLGQAAEILLACPAVDAVIVFGVGYLSGAPVRRFESSQTAVELGLDKVRTAATEIERENARILGGLSAKYTKPIVAASDMVLTAYGDNPDPGIAELERSGVYVSLDPVSVAHIIAHMADRYDFLHGTPRPAWNR